MVAELRFFISQLAGYEEIKTAKVLSKMKTRHLSVNHNSKISTCSSFFSDKLCLLRLNPLSYSSAFYKSLKIFFAFAGFCSSLLGLLLVPVGNFATITMTELA